MPQSAVLSCYRAPPTHHQLTTNTRLTRHTTPHHTQTIRHTTNRIHPPTTTPQHHTTTTPQHTTTTTPTTPPQHHHASTTPPHHHHKHTLHHHTTSTPPAPLAPHRHTLHGSDVWDFCFFLCCETLASWQHSHDTEGTEGGSGSCECTSDLCFKCLWPRSAAHFAS